MMRWTRVSRAGHVVKGHGCKGQWSCGLRRGLGQRGELRVRFALVVTFSVLGGFVLVWLLVTAS